MSYQGRFFDEGRQGRLFGSVFGAWPARHLIVFCPPFAEEMNLSRAIVSRQARALAAEGWTVLCLDYFGTGDSEGEFEEATADLWLEDLHAVLAQLGPGLATPPVLWGLRFGALIAATYAERYGAESLSGLVFWKPVLDGKLLLNQFFRLKQMQAMMQGGEQAKVNWLQRVRDGESTEVAGYLMTPALVNSIHKLNFGACEQLFAIPALWIEPGASGMTPVVEKQIQHWPEDSIQFACCASPAFWQNPDIYEAPDLISLTSQHLSHQQLSHLQCNQRWRPGD